MSENLKRFFLLLGLMLYIFDLASDILVADKHWNNDETWWFGLTVVFICFPSIIVNFAAIIQIMDTWTCTTAFAQLSIVARYVEAIIEPNADVDEFPRTYLLAILRYVETIAESAPQLCLQVYIMLRQQVYPTFTIVSTVVSVLSLTWSIVVLENERRKNNDVNFKCMKAFVFLIWQLSTLVSRLLAIVMFAYVFQYYVIFPLATHLLIVMGMIYRTEISPEGGVRKSLFSSFLFAISSLVHPAVSVRSVQHAKLGMIVGYIFHILTTIIMYTISCTAPEKNGYNLSGLCGYNLIPFLISNLTIAPIICFRIRRLTRAQSED